MLTSFAPDNAQPFAVTQSLHMSGPQLMKTTIEALA